MFGTFRFSLRFVVALTIVLGLMAFAAVPLIESLTLRWFMRDLDMRTHLIAGSVQRTLVDDLKSPRPAERINALFTRLIEDERLYAVAFCDEAGRVRFRTSTFPDGISCNSGMSSAQSNSRVESFPSGPLHIAYVSVADLEPGSHLVIVHDLSFVARRSADARAYVIALFIVIGVVIGAVTIVVARFSWNGWIRSLRLILKGEGVLRSGEEGVPATSPEWKPIVGDLRELLQDLETERQSRGDTVSTWGPESLRSVLRQDLVGDEVLIVSNREPYIHVRRGDKIEVQLPASGLVTALEPIMRACSGTWIAHGSGDADREVVDGRDRVRVPPEQPSYAIRRVWLTPEEEQGYYYGFANEGIWALCHIAHVRPVFRSEDWTKYVEVNQRFADAVIQEAKTEDPIVLVQDYHMALVPRMVRERLPRATILTFWHIPFPNSEVFGICPWREEIISGLLGSDILGFHTRFHCNNFLDSVDRFLESRIDRDASTVTLRGHVTAVKPYPISIEHPSAFLSGQEAVPLARARIRERYGLPQGTRIAIGVDRLDYTKGIIERFHAVERLFERSPEWIGRFSFVQIAAPSRSTIPQYQRFDAEVRALAEKINARFSGGAAPPIVLRIEHHGQESVYAHYRAADFCVVSSLHDGMNLVAKEFLAARDDEQGALVLSQFAGAAREFPEAFVVNPYHVDQCAEAFEAALRMPPEEQRKRMRSMRAHLAVHNVYRWAGRMLIDAARLRKWSRVLGAPGVPPGPRSVSP